MTSAEKASDRLAHAAAFRLTTAEILYRLPDHPNLLQSYVWQAKDIPPRFPALRKFLRFWEEQLDGPVHSVRVDALCDRGVGRGGQADLLAAQQ